MAASWGRNGWAWLRQWAKAACKASHKPSLCVHSELGLQTCALPCPAQPSCPSQAPELRRAALKGVLRRCHPDKVDQAGGAPEGERAASVATFKYVNGLLQGL